METKRVDAGVAQLVELHLAKVVVASSSLVSRFFYWMKLAKRQYPSKVLSRVEIPQESKSAGSKIGRFRASSPDFLSSEM